MAFDLDPGPPAALLDAVGVALLLRDVLAGAGLRAWAKTSGGKGMQVYVPLNTGPTYDRTKRFARTVAELLASRLPEQVTARVARAERPGKVLVDWAQNDRHRSIVGPYSLRARNAPTVSTPVGWDELEAAAAAADAGALVFGPDEVVARLQRAGDLFAPVLSERQPLP